MNATDFVLRYGGRRLNGGGPLPNRLPTGGGGEPDTKNVDLAVEFPLDGWKPIDVSRKSGLPDDFGHSPVRFIDGKDLGRTIAWLQTPEGFAVPVRLAEIGGVAIRLMDGELRRESDIPDRVVSIPTERFPAEEVDQFEKILSAHHIKLLHATASGSPDDFVAMRESVDMRTTEEMIKLECGVLKPGAHEPSIVDGRLEPHLRGFNPDLNPVFGLIKSHFQTYLPSAGIRLMCNLRPGERTPLLRLTPPRRLSTLTWYLRLNDPNGGQSPDWGVVRLEASWEWAQHCVADLSDFADRLSNVILAYRHSGTSYVRADISLHPIVRAEEILGAILPDLNQDIQKFYILTGL